MVKMMSAEESIEHELEAIIALKVRRSYHAQRQAIVRF